MSQIVRENLIPSAILTALQTHAELVQTIYHISQDIAGAASLISESLSQGGRMLLCGNGGSAADAQHLAAELVGRFEKERRALSAIALTTDTSAITALGNDYSFDQIFSRQVSAHGRIGDVLLAISTSGNSPNVVKAAEEASRIGLKVIGLTGLEGGALKESCSICLCIPSTSTARIQEMHILIGHIICQLVEDDLC